MARRTSIPPPRSYLVTLLTSLCGDDLHFYWRSSGTVHTSIPSHRLGYIYRYKHDATPNYTFACQVDISHRIELRLVSSLAGHVIPDVSDVHWTFRADCAPPLELGSGSEPHPILLCDLCGFDPYLHHICAARHRHHRFNLMGMFTNDRKIPWFSHGLIR